MEARNVKLIETSGRNGMPAPEFMGDRPAEGIWMHNLNLLRSIAQ